MIEKLLEILQMSFGMLWEILWALVLGFLISAVIQAVVSKKKIVSAMGDNSAKSIARASGLGAASSSCSYAATAIARSLFRKGADFTASIVFQFASTNLVIELGIILLILLGWQFTLAEFIGGAIMILLIWAFFRFSLSKKLVEAAKTQANKGLKGSMEGHAAMDMSQDAGTFWQKVFSGNGKTAISHYFVMDWASLWRDILLGLVIAGILAVLVPNSFWQSFFIEGSGFWSKVWGPLIGPIVAMASFVCSIGNVPLAAVLWNGGISFGGVISFIFADLLIIPILNIYRKYYGLKMSAFLLVTSYLAMVMAGYMIEIIFSALHILPTSRSAIVTMANVSWNYTTILNLIFLLISGVLLVRFFKTGGPEMLQEMEQMPTEEKSSCTHCH